MQEMSLAQTRELHEAKIGEAMRHVQDTRTLMQEFGNIIDRLRAVEPTSPLAGAAQHEVILFCEEARATCRRNAEHRQTVVDRLKAERP
jgi:hypothetical protein